MFNESFQNVYTITYDSWYTERKLSTKGNELQVEIGSAQLVNSPNYLIASFQKENRIRRPSKNNNITIFDNVDVKKYFAEIDGHRHPKDAVLTYFSQNSYLDQYRDVKLFYKEYVGETLMSPFISYSDMKKNILSK